MQTETAAGVYQFDHIGSILNNKKRYHAFKRFLDIFFSIILLISLAPLFLIVPVLIFLTSPGPVFFKQKRLGYRGNLFTVIKFRTLGHQEEEDPGNLANFAFVHGYEDPRITTIGKILRRTSIDELPQLFNVIKGEMSLVGPRPLVPSMMVGYEGFSQIRTLVKPGITGLFQVRDRGSKNFVDPMIKHDVEYLERCNIFLDFKILFMTIPAVIRGHGAF